MSTLLQAFDHHKERPAHILVVDDDATVCRMLEAFLQSKNYAVTAVRTTESVMKLLRSQTIDMVLLDLMLTDSSGIDMLRQIRESFSALQIPVIMLTASDDVSDITACLDAGANDYITKPGTSPILLARIQTQLSLKSINDYLSANKKDLEREVINKEVAYELAKSNLATEMDARIEMEKALHISERKFEDLFNNTPAVYMKLDAQGKVISVNRFGAFLLKYEQSELIGLSVFELYHESDRDLAHQYIKETVDNPKRLHRWELRKMNRHAEVMLMRETVRLSTDIDGESRLAMISVDVTTNQKSDITLG